MKSTTSQVTPSLIHVISGEEISFFQELVRRVPVADNVIDFAVRLATITRPDTDAPQFIKDWLSWGAGPRASQYLILGAKTRALSAAATRRISRTFAQRRYLCFAIAL